MLNTESLTSLGLVLKRPREKFESIVCGKIVKPSLREQDVMLNHVTQRDISWRCIRSIHTADIGGHISS